MTLPLKREDGPTDASEEDWWTAMIGLELQHDLHMNLRTWESWDAVVQHLREAGADLYHLSMNRHDAGIQVRCRCKNITPAQARAITDQAIAQGLTHGAWVEHLMLTK